MNTKPCPECGNHPLTFSADGPLLWCARCGFNNPDAIRITADEVMRAADEIKQQRELGG